MIFRGRFEYTIDPKSRVNIPAAFREQLEESGQKSFVITNYSGCIYAYPADDWARIEEKLSSVSSVDRKLNTFLRFFVGGAVEVVPDKQGRILIPPSLRTYAGLDKDVVITGMLTRIEIWAADRWAAEAGRCEKEMLVDPEMAQAIRSIGI